MSHWDNAMAGGMGIVQIGNTSGVPNIPGSVTEDIKKVNIPKSNGHYLFKDFLNKIYGKETNYINSYYSSLKKHGAVLYRYFYWWAGRYSRNFFNMSRTIEINITDDRTYEYYVGYIIYWNGLGSHRHRNYDKNPCIVDITITFIDGTTVKERIVSPYIGPTHDVNYSSDGGVGRQEYIKKTTSKAIRKINVTFNFYNAGAEWHDVSDSKHGSIGLNNYVSYVINRGLNTHKNSLIPNLVSIIDYTKILNLKAGTASNNVIKDETLAII